MKTLSRNRFCKTNRDRSWSRGLPKYLYLSFRSGRRGGEISRLHTKHYHQHIILHNFFFFLSSVVYMWSSTAAGWSARWMGSTMKKTSGSQAPPQEVMLGGYSTNTGDRLSPLIILSMTLTLRWIYNEIRKYASIDRKRCGFFFFPVSAASRGLLSGTVLPSWSSRNWNSED